MFMTVISRGTGRVDYSQDIAKTVMPDIGGISIDQGKLYFKTTVTVGASTTTTYTLSGVVVSPNHKWEIYDIAASGDSNVLMYVQVLRDSDNYSFISKYGYGTATMSIQRGFDIAAGDTIKFVISNFDTVNAHTYFFTFHGIDITLAP